MAGSYPKSHLITKAWDNKDFVNKYIDNNNNNNNNNNNSFITVFKYI